MPRDYIILDIETQSGIYGDISTDLNEIYKWMLKTYDWLDEENGILLHHSGSAGIKVNNKHENIRVRAIVKTNMPITQKRTNMVYLSRYKAKRMFGIRKSY